MFRRYIFLAVIALTWASAQSQGCPSGICDFLVCEETDKEACLKRNGVIAPLAGICGCCPACVKKLNENDTCIPFTSSMDNELTAACDEGLTCDENTKKCFSLEKCGPHHNIKGYNASCEMDFTFSPVQCSSKSCWCSGPKGEFLGNKVSPEEGSTLGCGCLVQQLKNKVSFGANRVSCDDFGNFKKLQCYENKCFCVDNITGERTSKVVTLDDREILKCGN